MEKVRNIYTEDKSMFLFTFLSNVSCTVWRTVNNVFANNVYRFFPYFPVQEMILLSRDQLVHVHIMFLPLPIHIQYVVKSVPVQLCRILCIYYNCCIVLVQIRMKSDILCVLLAKVSGLAISGLANVKN
jgi:hypothetical protein